MSRDTYRSNRVLNDAIKLGLSKYYAGKSLMLAGKTWQSKDIVAAFDTEEAQRAAAERLHILWLDAVRVLRATVQANHRLRLDIKATIRANHGASSATFATFGFDEKEPRKPTVQTVKEAVEKRAATRAARGTKGKRQRAKIKGQQPTG
jgi:hypothetical protein